MEREKGLKDDRDKLKYELVTPESLEGMAEVLTLGAQKYGPNTWQNVENGHERHYAALMRHLQAWRMGEKNDRESGYSHMKHVLTNAMFLLYHEQNNMDWSL